MRARVCQPIRTTIRVCFLFLYTFFSARFYKLRARVILSHAFRANSNALFRKFMSFERILFSRRKSRFFGHYCIIRISTRRQTLFRGRGTHTLVFLRIYRIMQIRSLYARVSVQNKTTRGGGFLVRRKPFFPPTAERPKE